MTVRNAKIARSMKTLCQSVHRFCQNTLVLNANITILVLQVIKRGREVTDNEIIKNLRKILNREYPEDIVPTAVCTVEFFREIYKFIDRLQGEVCYFEDRIDTINTEKNEIINRQKAEIEMYQKQQAETKEGLEKIMAKLDDAEASVLRDIQNAKTQAYKEFEDRLMTFLDESIEGLKKTPLFVSLLIQMKESVKDIAKELTENKLKPSIVAKQNLNNKYGGKNERERKKQTMQ